MVAVKETQCTSCGHRPVCSLSNTFLEIQKQTDNICVKNEKDNCVTRIVDLGWISVTVKCSHWISSMNMRRKTEDCNEQNL